MRFLITLFLIHLSLSVPLLAQDTLHAGQPFDNLMHTNSSGTYVHYQKFSDGRIFPQSMKTITVSQSNAQLFIVQEEFSQVLTKKLETVVEKKTLKTLSHNRTTGDKEESYQFTDTEVTGFPVNDRPHNPQFRIKLDEPTFNFEIDFILLQSIDWNKRDSVIMNLYHPGGSLQPDFYTYAKETEEKLTLADGVEVNTWVIFTDYNGQPPARFWISKETHQVLRQETDLMEMAGFIHIKQIIAD